VNVDRAVLATVMRRQKILREFRWDPEKVRKVIQADLEGPKPVTGGRVTFGHPE
jgi:hypothetical protein